MNQRPPPRDQDINALQSVPPRPPDMELRSLEIVSSSTLNLCQPLPDAVPAAWQTATVLVAQQLGFDVRQVPKHTASWLKELIPWVSSTMTAPPAPIFAPWRSWSPEALQQVSQLALPNASWVSTYVFGKQPKRPGSRDVIDIMLMSPLPGGCAPDHLIPQPKVLQAMIEAARSENRRKVTIVTDAQRRNGIVMHLLFLDLADNRYTMAIDVVSIEDALSELAGDPASGDAIIVLPDLRSLVFAMLSEITGISGPWPMMWHERNTCMISCEAIGNMGRSIPLDVSLLVQALALAAKRAGLISTAERLGGAAAALEECGGGGDSERFVGRDRVSLSDEDMIKTLGRSIASGQGAYPLWHAVAPRGALAKTRLSPRLTLVHSCPASEIEMPAC